MRIRDFIKSPVRISDSGRIRTKFSGVVDVKNAEINKLTEKVEQQAARIAELEIEVAARDRVLILQKAWKMAKCDKCSYPHTQECGYDRGCLRGMIAFAKADIEKE